MARSWKTSLKACCAAGGLVVGLGLGLGMGLGVSQAKADNVTDAMIGAYNSSGLLEQNRALLRATDENVAVAVARLRPVVSTALSISRSYSDSEPSGTRTDTTGAQLNLTLNWLLFDNGASQLDKASAKETVLSTRYTLLDVEQQVLFAAVQSYMNVLSQQDNVALRRNNLRLLQEELRAANDRFEVGEVTRTDVALAESRVAEAQANLINAQGDLLSARAVYTEVVGRAPGNVTAYPPLPRRDGGLQGARNNALLNHPSLKSQQHAVKAADLAAASSLRDMGPQLNLSATVAGNELHDSDGRSESSNISLNFSQTLYAGGSLAASRRSDLALLDAAKGSLISVQRQILREVDSAYAELDAASAALVASREQVRAAQVAFDGVREEATLGSRTTLDVLEAEQDLLNAQTARLLARNNQVLAAYSLLQAQGQLTAENLALGVELYDPEAYYNAVKSAPAFVSKQGQELDRVLKALGRN